jgi:hypothetical protein
VSETDGYCHHLSLPLTRFGLTLLTELLAELGEEEGEASSSSSNNKVVEPATFNLGTSFTSLQRLALIYSSVPIYTLLLRIAKAAYARAIRLMGTTAAKTSAPPPPPPPILASDRQQPVRRGSSGLMGAGSAEDDDDDEEESVLGRWMQNMLRPAASGLLSGSTSAGASPRLVTYRSIEINCR